MSTWNPNSPNKIMDEVQHSLLDNQGKACVGELTTTLLEKRLGKGAQSTTPLKSQEAGISKFKDMVKKAGNGYMKAIVILCG